MKTFIMASAALMLGTAPVALHAQDATGGTNAIEDKAADVVEMSEEQEMEYDSWPEADRTYYSTLTPSQQNAYWALTPDQRTQIMAMTPDQQAQAWTSIQSQLAAPTTAPPPSATATTATSAAASTGMNPDVVMQSNAMVQDAPAPHNGEYPLCTDGRTDNCVNPREAGEDFGNVPLDYWPGEPASEMDEG